MVTPINSIRALIESLPMFSDEFKESGWLTRCLVDRGDHKKITELGLLAATGNAIDYNGNGVVFIGCCNSGKSTLTQKFEGDGLAEFLTDDRLLMRATKGYKHFEILRYPRYETDYPGLSSKELIAKYAAHIANTKGIPLRAIVCLTFSPQTGFVGPDIDKITNYLTGFGTLYIPTDSSIAQELPGINILEYSSGDWLHNASKREPLETTYVNIKQKLASLFPRK